jgi:hypothetical protein
VIKNNRWGKREWKLNNSILNDEQLIKEIKLEFPKILTNKKGQNIADIITDWDKFKKKVKQIAIYHSTKRKRIQKIEKVELKLKINDDTTTKRDNTIRKARTNRNKGMEIG